MREWTDLLRPAPAQPLVDRLEREKPELDRGPRSLARDVDVALDGLHSFRWPGELKQSDEPATCCRRIVSRRMINGQPIRGAASGTDQRRRLLLAACWHQLIRLSNQQVAAAERSGRGEGNKMGAFVSFSLSPASCFCSPGRV